MTRLTVTKSAQLDAFKANALCPKCFKPFNGDVEFDHEIPLGLNGPDHDEKPMVPLHKDCHQTKTKADVKRIAKAKRQGGETGQWARRQKRGPSLKSGKKLQGRGFEKSLRKKMNGKVEKR